MKRLLAACAAFAAATAAAALLYTSSATERALPVDDGWRTLPSGLELGVFTVDPAPTHGDGRLVILRIDPARFELTTHIATRDGAPTTAEAWVGGGGVLAAINASMYGPDQRTAVSLLEADGHTNSGTLTADNSVLAFGEGAARIVDRTCEALPAAPTRIQGIRMLGCDGANVWARQPRRWSEAALGQDAEGRILFLFARTPWTAHTFVEHVRALPIGVTRLQHADGGPVAQVAWRERDDVVGLVGSYEDGAQTHDLQVRMPPVPNLVGVRRR